MLNKSVSVVVEPRLAADGLLAAANEIYEKYDEPTKGKKLTIRITQHGIARRSREL